MQDRTKPGKLVFADKGYEVWIRQFIPKRHGSKVYYRLSIRNAKKTGTKWRHQMNLISPHQATIAFSCPK